MATSLQLAIITVAVLLASFYFSPALAATSGGDPPFGASSLSVTAALSPAAPWFSHELGGHDSISPTTLFEPILTNLGFQELAMAVPSLSGTAFSTWNGPSTLFAPSDSSIRTCVSCSVPSLLREHIVPGLFSLDYLRKLAFGTKIETMEPGRCITVTSSTDSKTNSTRIYVGGVEITRPDLFNNGVVVVHGLDGFVAHLSPFSCSVEKMTSLFFPFHHPDQQRANIPTQIMRLMLRDAMLRLRTVGFGFLSLAIKVKYAELVNLQNMTVFALDDASIFSGGHDYVSNVGFHIVPNRLLTASDLERLPAGIALPTLERGQYLVVTTAGGAAVMRINYVRIKAPDVMRNVKIVVHSLYLPFPRLHHAVSYGGGEYLASDRAAEINVTEAGSCEVATEHGGCVAVAPTAQVKPMVEGEDYRGL
ncbi:hypothetical protein RJ639_041310 [Escallonia herrerae]|uniref:FAS1 domain-containing protein n=1 Tax=Escallonia herrerae TaxID=1293975 RepID=A0AA89B331_9ASTE|nr:hypothetical protein RJ639_041310 [Escallonia herrerae]